MKNWLFILAAGMLLTFAACESDEKEPNIPEEITEPGDINFEEKMTVSITFDGASATIKGGGDLSIKQDGANIEIISYNEGVRYALSGTTDDGSLKIVSRYNLKLLFNNLSLGSQKTSPINIQSSKTTYIAINGNTVNTLSDGHAYSLGLEDIKACISSQGELDFYGEGQLNVTGRCKHAIATSGNITIRENTNINVLGAIGDGIHLGKQLIIMGGILNVNSTGDGIESKEGNIAIKNGNITVKVGGVKADGLKALGTIRIEDGNVEVTTTGKASKGIKSDSNITIEGGAVSVETSGDAMVELGDTSSSHGLSSKGSITLSGGDITLRSSGLGGKGISCDKNLNVTGAITVVETAGKQFVEGALTSSPKGIKCEGDVAISNGYITVSAMGGEGAEGIDCKGNLTVTDGDINVQSYDDCLKVGNSAKASGIIINGGIIRCNSAVNDGFDASGSITINGGEIISAGGPGSTKEGFNCAQKSLYINGGTVIGVGGSSNTPVETSKQYCLVYEQASGSENQVMQIKKEGTVLLDYRLPKAYPQAMTLLYSTNQFAKDGKYTIVYGTKETGFTMNKQVTKVN